jgi:hypothetical protein
MIGGEGRSVVTSETRRRAYLKLVYENGFMDSFDNKASREQAYLDDEEALMRYRIGTRVGKRERERAA